jgi:hypothetical protein
MTSKSRLRLGLLSVGMTLTATAALAQSPAAPAPGTPELTAEQRAFLQARTREIRRQAGSESARVRGATQGVSVGLRCAEGYIERQRIAPSVADVEIVTASRTECDGSRCRALQVTARRPEGPFDLDVDITCSGS